MIQYQTDQVSVHGIGLQSINLQVTILTVQSSDTAISNKERMYSNSTFIAFNIEQECSLVERGGRAVLLYIHE